VTVGGQEVKAGNIKMARVGEKKSLFGTVRNGHFILSGTQPMTGGEYTVSLEYMSSGLGSGGYDQKVTRRITVPDLGPRFVKVEFP
jgi:hypothetical protein